MDRIEIKLEDLPDLKSRLLRIQKVTKTLAELPDNWLTPQGSVIEDIEIFILGAIKRTSSLADGFCAMIDTKNTLCAAPLIRLQIDTAMRVHGLSLVNDPFEAGKQLMNGTHYKELKSKNDRKLSDFFLRDSLSVAHPWVNEAYKSASGYVHLSREHFISSIDGKINGMLFFNLDGTEPKRKEEDLYHMVDTFYIAADLTKELILDFAKTHPGPKYRDHGWRNKSKL